MLGSQVLTDTGTDLGAVVDVIVEVGCRRAASGATTCDVVGYEIEASEALEKGGPGCSCRCPTRWPSRGAPHRARSAKDFVRHDLAGFGAAVEDFRAQLEGDH